MFQLYHDKNKLYSMIPRF